MFTCEKCQLHLPDVDSYFKHLNVEHFKNSEVDNSIESVASNFCSTCKKKFNGSVPFEEHLASKKHEKKLNESKLIKKNLNDDEMTDIEFTFKETCNYETVHELKMEENFEDLNKSINSSSLFSCNICNAKFSGIIPYKQHLESKKHHKKLRESEIIEQIKFNKSMEDAVIVDKITIISERESLKENDDKMINSAESFSCMVCKLPFTGIIPYQQHMISKKHEKKIKELQTLEQIQNNESDLNISFNENASLIKNIQEACNDEVIDVVDCKFQRNSDNNLWNNSCKQYFEVENTETNRQNNSNDINIPNESNINDEKVLIDMKSSNIEISLNSRENFIDNFIDNLNESSIKCEICNKYLSGIIPYNQHIEGSKHKKELIKTELMKIQFSNSDKNISFSPQEKENNEIQISENLALNTDYPNKSTFPFQNASLITISDKDNSLFCKVCNVVCSGVIPYKQHIESTKHLKKQLMLQKLSHLDLNQDSEISDLNNTPTCKIRETKIDVLRQIETSDTESLECDKDKFQLEHFENLSHDVNVFYKDFKDSIPVKEHKENKIDNFKIKIEDKTADIKNSINYLSDENYKVHPQESLNYSNFNKSSATELIPPKNIEVSRNDQFATSLQFSNNCNICGMSFTGKIPLQQHLDGTKHKKNMQKLQIAKRMIDNSSAISKSNFENVSTITSDSKLLKNISEQNLHEDNAQSVDSVDKENEKFLFLNIRSSYCNRNENLLENDNLSLISSTGSSIVVLEESS